MAKAKTTGLTIKLTRSLIGCKDDQIATANSLGLRRISDESVQPDNPATRGKIFKIKHLVTVTEGK